MKRVVIIGVALIAAMTGWAAAPSVAAAMRGEVFYVQMGETCPWGWTNRSKTASLRAAYGPTPEYVCYDMCIGGF